VGLLVTVSTGIGAVATLIGGALADRVNRARLPWISIVMWSAAMAFSVTSCIRGRGAGPKPFGPRCGPSLPPGASGLDHTFLIMLVLLFVAGVLMFVARRTYPRDVATAIASEHSTGQ
jgi:nitrate/nitrite transporter NarK